jgi:alpha-mannosidase
MDGHSFPVQVLNRQEGEANVLFTPLVPSFGSTAYKLRPVVGPEQTSLRVSTSRIESRFFLLELTPEGEIARLYDKRFGRETIPAGEYANVLQLFQDGPEHEAAWNVHATFAKRSYDWEEGVRMTVCEAGPVRAGVRIEKTYRQSKIIQDIFLYDQLPRIDFVTHCDWQERQVLLKAAFPLEVRAMTATFEIQFGVVERPTHRNTSWDQEKFEVCAHRWADLSEGGYGISLLNDCKYGYDAEGNVLRLTLLRGTEYPDPLADLGEHDFTYSLYPHAGDWRQGNTVRVAASLNQPLVCIAGASPAMGLVSPPSLFTVDGPAILDTVKPAEDGRGWILRFYEPEGSRGLVVLHTASPLVKVTSCNHIEEDGEVIPCDSRSFGFYILPFQVRTYRLE